MVYTAEKDNVAYMTFLKEHSAQKAIGTYEANEDMRVHAVKKPSSMPSLVADESVKKPSPAIRTSKRLEPPSQIHRCAKILKEVMKIEEEILTSTYGVADCTWFSKPVDPITLGIPDYFDVIKSPMDLGTVLSNCNKNVYSHPEDFAADVRLVFQNATTYNAADNAVHNAAKELESVFEAKFRALSEVHPFFSAKENKVNKVPQAVVRSENVHPVDNEGPKRAWGAFFSQQKKNEKQSSGLKSSKRSSGEKERRSTEVEVEVVDLDGGLDIENRFRESLQKRKGESAFAVNANEDPKSVNPFFQRKEKIVDASNSSSSSSSSKGGTIDLTSVALPCAPNFSLIQHVGVDIQYLRGLPRVRRDVIQKASIRLIETSDWCARVDNSDGESLLVIDELSLSVAQDIETRLNRRLYTQVQLKIVTFCTVVCFVALL